MVLVHGQHVEFRLIKKLWLEVRSLRFEDLGLAVLTIGGIDISYLESEGPVEKPDKNLQAYETNKFPGQRTRWFCDN